MNDEGFHVYIHTFCGRFALKLEKLSFHLGELLLQSFHCLSVLFLQVPHLISEAAAKDLILGCQVTHSLCMFRLHHHVL